MATQVLRVQAASATHVGQVRRVNEDACLVDDSLGMFMVADGMGGQQSGDVASRMVVEALPGLIDRHLTGVDRPTATVIRAALHDSIVELSRAVLQRGADHDDFLGMGATVVVALVTGRYAHLAHMGDSRAYLWRKRTLSLLTDDHSVVAMLVRSGKVAPVDAVRHPASGRLYRFVGMGGDTGPDIRTIALCPSDRLLLCSDGLTAMIPDHEIGRVLESNPEPHTACDRLVEAANRAGGKDNVTVLVVDFLALTRRQSSIRRCFG